MQSSRTFLTCADIDGLAWQKGADGLLPAIVQDASTQQVLMLAWMNPAAILETLETGEATFHSRSRGGRWRKGETSGNRLSVVEALTDCDRDTILLRVRPAGPACHEGTVSCFGHDVAPGVGWLGLLEQRVAERATAAPDESYTARLLSEGTARVAQKVGEEAVETVIAALGEDREELIGEAADLLYHLLVLLHGRQATLNEVMDRLRARST